ncbi:HAD family hydrolase [Bacillus sp. Marseille-Q3570]|uniref:HAD family hydrolase n=1 Tax=Bacillus sp. Marseille-Q3570 TaxID=2963522 RepID=UPI0021B79F44|nr:HAD family hydrolase [Bacillus sp. Marseille-Q3570]
MKALIFDFDGTLANTLPVCFHAFQAVFNRFDERDLTDDEIKEMFGPSETGIIRENLSHTEKDQAIELFYEKYSDSHRRLVDTNEEIIELLTFVKDKGMKLGIFTGKARRSLDISLQELQMDGMFDVIITGDDVTNPKPHPEGLQKALSQLGINEKEAMFIGDSNADIEAGLAANVHTAAVQWLPDYQTSQFDSNPDSIYKSVKQFLESLDYWTSKTSNEKT